jgi:hypothetical protein
MKRINDCAKKYQYAITLGGIIVALAGLGFLIAQTLSLGKQTQILSKEYEATYRPYLAVENIETKDGNGSSLEILIITVKNYGQMPATKVDLQKVVIGGADVKYNEETGTYMFIYGSGDTFSGYLIARIDQDYPPDFIFFPGKEQIIIATVDKSTYQAVVLETKLMHVALEYSYGLERYYYLAKAELQNGLWKVVENRGN